MVYGGTSGHAAHLLVGMFHGVTGMVLDLGIVPEATEVVAVCCASNKVVACVNGPGGGRVIAAPYQPLPFDLIQEWGFSRSPYEEIGSPFNNERILDAVLDTSGTQLIGVTPSRLFTINLSTGAVASVTTIVCEGDLAVTPSGGILGIAEDGNLWRYDPANGSLESHAAPLPHGEWKDMRLAWAEDTANGRLYTADREGVLFAFEEKKGFSPALGRLPLAPAGPMAVTLDGRLFGACGDEISNLFSYTPQSGALKNLGVAVSVLERRRYGYVFGAAAVGRDGQIYLGENDDNGHLWIYFPRIQSFR
jgi:hypothetical protein